MKTAGVVIEPWKLIIFQKCLDDAGFKYTQTLSDGNMIILKVEFEWVHKLQPVIEAAQAECYEVKHAQRT